MHLRAASEDDLLGLALLELACFGPDAFSESTLLWFLRHPRGFAIVAVDGEEIVGSTMGLVTGRPQVGKLGSLAVHPSRRRQRLADQLLRAAMGHFTAQGIEAVELEVETTNEPALALYGREGFRIVRRLDHYYGRGRHAYRMRVELPKAH